MLACGVAAANDIAFARGVAVAFMRGEQGHSSHVVLRLRTVNRTKHE